jgi:hypothetical protein
MFAAHRCERRLDARVIDVGVRQHMLGIGAPDDRQFGLAVFSGLRPVQCWHLKSRPALDS